MGGCPLGLPPGRTLAPFWTGFRPACALAPAECWTAPAGSIWGLEPPGLPLGQYGGQRVRNQKPGHQADPFLFSAACTDPGTVFLHARVGILQVTGTPANSHPLLPCLDHVARVKFWRVMVADWQWSQTWRYTRINWGALKMQTPRPSPDHRIRISGPGESVCFFKSTAESDAAGGGNSETALDVEQ